MAKYGQFRYAEQKYGTGTLPTPNRVRSVHRICLSAFAQKSFNAPTKESTKRYYPDRTVRLPKHCSSLTFRTKRKVDSLGRVRRVDVQEKFRYTVPSSINNPEGEPSRQKFTLAVYTWQLISEIEKKLWNQLAGYNNGVSGYNCFIRAYMLF